MVFKLLNIDKMMPVGIDFRRRLRNSIDTMFRSRASRQSREDKRKKRLSFTLSDSNTACPLCKEEFEQVWDKELHEWIAKDVICVDQLYHESCYQKAIETGDFGKLHITRPGSVAILKRHSMTLPKPLRRTTSVDENLISPRKKDEDFQDLPAK